VLSVEILAISCSAVADCATLNVRTLAAVKAVTGIGKAVNRETTNGLILTDHARLASINVLTGGMPPAAYEGATLQNTKDKLTNKDMSFFILAPFF
jgi:hypothetical protein